MKIYILCPPNFFTGGPLGLHQLCSELVARQFEAYIFYPISLTNWWKDPVHDNYRHFENPIARRIEDSSENILIVPEILTSYFRRYKKIKKGVWWLSVDNYFVYNENFEKSSVGKLKRFFGKGPLKMKEFNYSVNVNLAQSFYAYDFLVGRDLLNPVMLHDYIPEPFFRNYDLSAKKDIVLYNPKKGLAFTTELMNRIGNVEFIPLVNLTPGEVVDLLLISKVYIDFGEHPGRDRFPREAAILGNVIICGRDGSAANPLDINVPEMYKFQRSVEYVDGIDMLIKDVFSNFNFHLDNQRNYGETIRLGKQIFRSEVDEIINFFD